MIATYTSWIFPPISWSLSVSEKQVVFSALYGVCVCTHSCDVAVQGRLAQTRHTGFDSWTSLATCTFQGFNEPLCILVSGKWRKPKLCFQGQVWRFEMIHAKYLVQSTCKCGAEVCGVFLNLPLPEECFFGCHKLLTSNQKSGCLAIPELCRQLKMSAVQSWKLLSFDQCKQSVSICCWHCRLLISQRSPGPLPAVCHPQVHPEPHQLYRITCQRQSQVCFQHRFHAAWTSCFHKLM